MAEKTLVIESSFDGLDLAVDFIEEFCTEHNCTDELCDKVLLLGSELVTNGIEHGNKLDVEKKVSLIISSDESGIQMIVKDQGEGFELQDVADPTAIENILKEGGRGIFLIKELADEFSLEDGGTVVKAKCYR